MALEGNPIITPSETSIQCNDLDLIPETVDFQDGCPVLPKMNIHAVSRGQCGTLEKVIRDRNGNPVNLSNCLCDAELSVSDQDEAPLCGVIARFREATGYDSNDKIHTLETEIIDAGNGVVRITLPEVLVNVPGLYKAIWGVFNDGKMYYSMEGYLIVENGLFGFTTVNEVMHGPPSLREIRLTIRDNAPSENTLLRDVEFSDVEIGEAILRPVRQWEEMLPPLCTHFTTKTFPFKDNWITGTQAYLYDMAEAWYRRNYLKTTAGGIQIADRDKEKEYLRAAQIKLKEFKDWALLRKTEINAQSFMGEIGSTYGRSWR
jgi:hypothetical protein